MSALLPVDPAELQALLVAERTAHAVTRLERNAAKAKLQALLKRYFGRASEKLDPNQLALAWAAVEADHAVATLPPPPPAERKPRTPSVRRAQRLEDLPVLETITLDLPAAAKFAPDGTALVKIRDEITDEVDYQPGKLFRRQIIRPVYASPIHAGAPQIAALPARVIPGGQVGPGLIAQVLLSKYADAIPLYRQAAMLERLGPGFSRQAMGQWVEQGAGLFRPVYQALQKIVLQSGYVQGDETPIRVLDPARPGCRARSVAVDFSSARTAGRRIRFSVGPQSRTGAGFPASVFRRVSDRRVCGLSEGPAPAARGEPRAHRARSMHGSLPSPLCRGPRGGR